MQKVGVVYTKFLLSATPSCVLLDVFQSFGFPVSLCWHMSPMATFKVSLPCCMSSLGCSDPGMHPWVWSILFPTCLLCHGPDHMSPPASPHTVCTVGSSEGLPFWDSISASEPAANLHRAVHGHLPSWLCWNSWMPNPARCVQCGTGENSWCTWGMNSPGAHAWAN